MKFIYLLFCVSTAMCSFKLYADGNILTLREVMPQEQIKRSGLDKLTPEQRRSLEIWISKWTVDVITHARSYRPQMNLAEWIREWPSYDNPTRGNLSPEQEQQRTQANQVIVRNINNGTTLELKNGSVWEIAETYRYVSNGWHRNDVVQILKSENNEHPFVLKNLTQDNQIVQANLKTAASPTGVRKSEPPSYYKGAVLFAGQRNYGQFVDLQNNTSWEVQPQDYEKTRNWFVNDRIRVGQSRDYYFVNTLTNLDTGEVVLARPERSP